MKVKLSKPTIDRKEISAVTKVLKSGWYAHGPKNKEFEEMFARYIGVRHAITVNSCTAALFLSVLALDIKGEVIIPSFTFVATANAVVTAGATPVFVDVDYETGNINPQEVEAAITSNTQAIICVHFAGQPCKMDELVKIAKKHKLFLIEDSAEAIGATFNGRRTGSFGVTGCFSFFPTKNITTGEGGMITTNDDALNKKIRALLAHGIVKDTLERQKTSKPWQRSATYAGYNFRMSNILAAIGVEQMKKIDRMNKLRTKKSRYLMKNLKNIDQIELPYINSDTNHVFQMFTVKVKNGYRDKLLSYLVENGIEASVHFDPPVHLQTFYLNKYKKRNLDSTEKLSEDIITLPLYPDIPMKELSYVGSKIKEFFG